MRKTPSRKMLVEVREYVRVVSASVSVAVRCNSVDPTGVSTQYIKHW